MTGVDGGLWMGPHEPANEKLQSARRWSQVRGHVGSASCFVYGFREKSFFPGVELKQPTRGPMEFG